MATEITTIEEAREAAKNFSGQNETDSFFQELTDTIKEINPEEGGMDELAMLMSLDDDNFAVLAPAFLDELQRTFNDPTNQFIMARSLNENGMSADDIENVSEELLKSLDNELASTLSRQKIDFLKQLIMMSFNAVKETQGITKRFISIPIEFCNPNAKMPSYAHVTDAGADIYALEDITVKPGETKLIPTGIKIAVPYGYEVQIRPKSGKSLKTKFRVANAPGTIDSGYRDEIGVIIDNIEPPIKDIQVIKDENGNIIDVSVLYGEDFTIGKGEKFAQMVLCENPKMSFYEISSISEIGENRGGGFGSTDNEQN